MPSPQDAPVTCSSKSLQSLSCFPVGLSAASHWISVDHSLLSNSRRHCHFVPLSVSVFSVEKERLGCKERRQIAAEIEAGRSRTGVQVLLSNAVTGPGSDHTHSMCTPYRPAVRTPVDCACFNPFLVATSVSSPSLIKWFDCKGWLHWRRKSANLQYYFFQGMDQLCQTSYC